MREFNEDTLTEAVLQRFAATPDPRLRQIVSSFVKHLHAFVTETRPSLEEWAAGIRFLTETGKMCDDRRQEFILLSDTLGVSMLVDFINYGKHASATESTVLGPFFVEAAPEVPPGGSIVKPGTPGKPCVVTGRVTSTDGKPLAGAVLDVWEGGSDGFYDVQKPEGTNLRGRVRADDEGRFGFTCILPVSYPVPTDGPVGRMLAATGRHPMRPAHLHFMINAPGHRRLVTHLFVAGDKYLDSDAVFGVKESLVVQPQESSSAEEAARWQVQAPFWRIDYDFALLPL